MKRILLGITPLILVLVTGCSSSQPSAEMADRVEATMTPVKTPTFFESPETAMKYQESITASDMQAMLYYLASDYFEGRETATKGEKLAALYLASQYKKHGLEPKGTGAEEDNILSRYLQPFPVYAATLKEATLSVTRGGEAVASSEFSADVQDAMAYPMSTNAPAETSAPLLFGGYGIEDAELGYDDVAAIKATGLNIEDHWVLLLADEPLSSASKSLLPPADGGPSAGSPTMNRKFRAMFTLGMPKGVMIVSDASPRTSKSVEEQARERGSRLNDVGGLSLTKPDGNGRQSRRPPIFMVSTDLANQMLEGSGKTIQTIQEEINSSLKPVSFLVPDVEITSTFESTSRELASANVAAFVEGSDLKDEVVVLSSHYDHIGMGYGEGDVINNGADDDGSGTVTILEIAEAFQKAKEAGDGPRRSLLFLNVAGEEKGLLGSAYYSDMEPLLPLEKTVTNLNIDMVGRHDPTHPDEDQNYVYIIGSKLISQELHDLNAQANVTAGTNLVLHERFNSKEDPNRFYARSDHWNFGKHNIPFIFFFTGTHEDYHRVGDEPHKIDYDRMEDIAQMIFATAWQVANQDIPPAVSGDGFN
ncbi:MAG: M28 family peptidase [Rhodothermales bacterium]|nr:M28 family peptidase [Rhodothermales bacterium]